MLLKIQCFYNSLNDEESKGKVRKVPNKKNDKNLFSFICFSYVYIYIYVACELIIATRSLCSNRPCRPPIPISE